ncbi:hypothetical protein [Aeromicrobium sp. NPDC092404]|uniref:hypothetical protein n=1 Tax=Aeromicrobium sp. NPDC092404 TaxID=3154976 RepID=UPI0034374FB7
MRGSRALQVATAAAAVVLLAYVVDLAAGSNLDQDAATVGRVLAIIGAAVCAAVIYQLWSVREHHTARDHAAAAAALLGGALAASSAFSAHTGDIFGSSVTATAGIAGLALAIVGSRPHPLSTEGRR